MKRLAALLILVASPALAEGPRPVEILPPDIAATVIGILQAGNVTPFRLRPANDELTPGPNNNFVGFAPIDDVTQGNTAPGALFGLTFKGLYPPAGVGLQIQRNLTPAQCAALSLSSSEAVALTEVPDMQLVDTHSGVSFPPPIDNSSSAGGVCSPEVPPQYRLSFAGWIGHSFSITIQVFSAAQCAFVVNTCSGSCSCGPYSRSGGPG